MWGQNWGTLVWGNPVAAPTMTTVSLILLGATLALLGRWMLRHGAKPRTTALFLGVLAAIVPLTAGALGPLPFTFTNGTVADATQVNANFEALRTGVTNLENRAYGDGSAGPLAISTNTDWSVSPPSNTNFTTCDITSLVTLTVPSGTIIRCTGGFSLDAFMRVNPSARGHVHNRGAEAGLAPGGAGDGAVGNFTSINTIEGGVGGQALTEVAARMIRYPGANAGGGGGMAIFRGGGAQPNTPGGGSLVILAKGPIKLDSGNILAETVTAGTGTTGGGAGGFVILASQTLITGTGGISVKGTVGATGQHCVGGGGGGGGGIVHLYAPVITHSGTISVTGGVAGINGMDNCVDAQAGGGGGALGGNGGNGATIQSGGTHTPPGAGASGLSLRTLADPTFAF
jgi:hypothetical protein